MGTNLCLFACALAVTQPAAAERADWQLTPQLSRGQELVYRGTFNEETVGTGVQFQRAYRMETRVFVLGSGPEGADVAFMTLVKQRTPVPAQQGAESETSSVRLELARVNSQGRVTAEPGGSVAAPLEGPPTIEAGFFVEAPRHRVRSGQPWEVGEEGRPPRTWTIAGSEAVGDVSGIKLVGVQQSDDWDKPRADHTAWRREDTVWLAPRGGYALRLERTIQRREPARRGPTHKSVVRYELESTVQFPGQLGDDRKKEILLGRSLSDSLAPLLPRAGEVGPKPFEAILSKIRFHVDHAPPTPYRAVLKQVQVRAEAGRRGESPPAPLGEERGPVHPVLALGRPAPDFLVKDLTSNESTGLRRWLGKPTLMVFYSPTSSTVAETLGFAQALIDTYPQQVTVLALAVCEDAAMVLKQRSELGLTFPILSGTGLRLTYGIDSTPKMIILDGAGVVRSSLVGWGPESATTIKTELFRWVRKDPAPDKTSNGEQKVDR
jgi:peroxiredoxin